MIYSKLVQDGRLHVLDATLFLNRVVPEFICGAVDYSTFYSATGHPNTEAVWIVIAAVATLRERSSTKFSGPND